MGNIKEFKPEEYKPLQYESWDRTGRGANIRKLLTPKEREIWDLALPYQDKRNDVGHAEIVTYFALKLLEYIDADRAVVIPAAILHDTGWGKLIPEILPCYNPLSEDFKKNEPFYRKLHQENGVVIGQEVLKKADYPSKYIPHICEIVSQHDTRNGFYSKEDGAVRDSDKLWRFTPRQQEMDYMKSMTFEERCQILARDIKKSSFFYYQISREIAKAEAEQTIRYLRKEFKKQ